MDEKTYDTIDRYLRNEMGAEERASFEQRLKDDAELRAETEWLSTAFQSAGRTLLKAQLAEIFTGVPAGSLAKYKPSVPAKTFLQKWGWAVAIVVAAAAALVWWNLSHREEEREPSQPVHDTTPPAKPAYDPDAQPADTAPGERTETHTTTTTVRHDTIFSNGEKNSTVTVKKDSVVKQYRYEPQGK